MPSATDMPYQVVLIDYDEALFAPMGFEAAMLAEVGARWETHQLRTPEAVLDALRTGAFYASTGVEVETVSCSGTELTVVAPNADAFNVFKMNGARIGTGSVVGVGAVVTEGTVIPPGSLVLGLPGKVVRPVGETDTKRIRHAAEHYVQAAKAYRQEMGGDA